MRNRLVAQGAQFVVDNEDAFPGRVVRDPQTGVITLVDQRAVNLARIDAEGVDLSLGWRWTTRYGDFSPSLDAAWVGKHEQQLTAASPLEDRLGVIFGVPRWKGTTTLWWSYQGDVQATLIGRYVSRYVDDFLANQGRELGIDLGPAVELGDFWQFDLNVDLGLGRWLAPGTSKLSGTRLSIGAVNLFNRLPDFCNSCGVTGYDPRQYDIRGRFAYADVKFGF